MARALGLLAVTSVYAFSHDKSAACSYTYITLQHATRNKHS